MAKVVPRLPRLGFPPLDPLFRGAPWTRYPQGGETHPGTPGHECRASRGAGVPLGGAARPHGPRRRPAGHIPTLASWFIGGKGDTLNGRAVRPAFALRLGFRTLAVVSVHKRFQLNSSR